VTIKDIVDQGGGVSILNNIFDPTQGEFTSLHYELDSSGMVSVQVFDLAGGMVEILHRGRQQSGEYSVMWNGRNRAGNIVARGVYFIRIVGPGMDEMREVMVVK
jgi:fibronectin-binding autotransporter adhesin